MYKTNFYLCFFLATPSPKFGLPDLLLTIKSGNIFEIVSNLSVNFGKWVGGLPYGEHISMHVHVNILSFSILLFQLKVEYVTNGA